MMTIKKMYSKELERKDKIFILLKIRKRATLCTTLYPRESTKYQNAILNYDRQS